MRWPRSPGVKAGAVLVLTAVLAGPACAPGDQVPKARFASHELTDRGLLKLTSGMDPAMRALALRHDPGQRRADLWARPMGWSNLDLDDVPTLGFDEQADAVAAAELNNLRPFTNLPIRPMKPGESSLTI